MISRSIKSTFSIMPKRVLCAVLAVLIGYCALMIALPGFGQLLFAASKTTAFHACADDAKDAQTEGAEVAALAQALGDEAAKHRADGASVCSADFLGVENSNTFSNVTMALAAVLFYVVALYVVSLALQPRLQRSDAPVPPFGGQLRSHLGLSRIHV